MRLRRTGKSAMSGMASTLVIVLLLCAGQISLSAATLQSGVLDAGRSIDWTNTGVPGGIPNRTTIYATIDAATYGNGVTDASAAIQTAWNNCPANQVVYLPPGTYRLNTQVDLKRRTGATLRGAGPGQTILSPACYGAAITNYSIDLSEQRNITSGSTKGSRTITVSDATGIVVGSVLDIYQDPNADFFWSRWGHTWGNGQYVKVTAISGLTLTLEDPLVCDFSVNPHFRYQYYDGLSWCGVEDLTINADANFQYHLIRWWNAYACWVKNVETIGGKYFTDGTDTVHVSLYGCLRCEVRDSYLHDAPSAFGVWTIKSWDGAYGSGGCTGLRVENNIFSNLGLPIINEGEVGGVFAYNYFRGTTYWAWPDYQVPDLNGNHGEHGMMNLYEGNVLVGYQADGYHGSVSNVTLYRNWLSAQHVDANRTGNIKTIDLCRYSYYFNVVGNVLGNPLWPTATIGAYEMTGMPGYEQQTVVYRLGYPNMGNNGYSLVNPPSNGSDGGYDPKVKSTLMRWGNFDYQSNAARWNSSEIPAGVTVPASQTLPASFYLVAKPSWWGAGAWPAIGPDVAGLVTKIPAQLRFEGGAAGSLAFSAATYGLNEGNSGTSTVTITVTRSGGSTGAVGISYATANGTATAGSDYTATSGTLSWANGDSAAKTFLVTITGDVSVESSETIALSLSTPTGGAALGTSSATVTITNDDVAPAGTLSFNATTYSQAEGNSGTATVTITATRTGGSNGAVGASYATSNGTATSGSDYTAASGTLSWANGDTASKTFTVTITGDTTVESDETVLLALSSATGGASLGTSSATLTITNDDAAPVGTLAFSAATYSQAEGNSSTATVTITATRTGGSNGAVGISYATANGTATAGSDYTAASGTLSWASGNTAAKTFTVTITGDTTVESNETVLLSLSSPTGGASLGTSSATLTITNDDAAPAGTLAFSAATYSQAEGNSGSATVTITATRTGGSNGAVGVSYATANGTATAGSDYTAASGTLSWANGDTASKTFAVTITGDTTAESDETVLLSLSSATGGASLGTSSATLTITNDDAAPAGVLAFSAATYAQNEGDSGLATITITATRTGGSNGAVGVSYGIANGTATAGSDYTATSGTLSWANGDAAAKTFTVTITGDTTVESNETVSLSLSSATGGASLGTSSATLTITNDDAAPAGTLAFSAATYSQAEGNSGTATVTITATRTGGSSGAVGVSYATANGTATAGSDYTAASGTLSWANGITTSKTFTVTITGDNTIEASETVLLSLSAATGGATLGTSSATLTITNDDVAAAPTITTQPVNRSVTAPATATFSVVASGTPTPTYQWQSSPSGSSTYTAIAGATAASYTTGATTTTMTGMKYRCVATNGSGSATSSVATLTVSAGSGGGGGGGGGGGSGAGGGCGLGVGSALGLMMVLFGIGWSVGGSAAGRSHQQRPSRSVP